ncbi:MAG: GIY-YIG nuclease family protein [Candidatus Thiodiazotropha sp. (ex Gloverina cf. vestifex)]|nr:GIY-YIG nuclease family protein [Candidatus Thiodiazotropha sp. (ex Gloverina cf. vestifex)]
MPKIEPGNSPGTYILLLRCKQRQRIRIGKLGEFPFLPGWYLYVGSAFGPGGVAARCNHHCRISVRPHWHIDYLRSALALREIWFTHDPVHREHHWARCLASGMGLSSPVHRFGASDCDCGSHLFFSAVKSDCEHFQALQYADLGRQAAVYCKFV